MPPIERDGASARHRWIDDVGELLRLIGASEFEEVEVASGSLTVSVRRDPAGTIAPELLTSLSPAATSDISVTIRAPGVGVYRRVTGARGDSPVEAGQPVSIGQAVGAVETLGMLNRVIAEEAGVVDQIHVADGDAVEFGQPLVTLRLS